jgi:hypothetical protein
MMMTATTTFDREWRLCEVASIPAMVNVVVKRRLLCPDLFSPLLPQTPFADESPVQTGSWEGGLTAGS